VAFGNAHWMFIQKPRVTEAKMGKQLLIAAIALRDFFSPPQTGGTCNINAGRIIL